MSGAVIDQGIKGTRNCPNLSFLIIIIIIIIIKGKNLYYKTSIKILFTINLLLQKI